MSFKAFSFKSAIGVLTVDANKAGILTTYDKDGIEIGKSPAVSILSPDDIDDPVAQYVSSKGKQYLMLTQYGAMVPDPSSTKKTGNGVAFSSFDGETGKLLKSGVIELGSETAGVIPGGVLVNVPGTGENPLFIDPVSGVPDRITDEKWLARVDGVDLSFEQSKQTFFDKGVITAPTWSIPEASVRVKNGPLIAKGRYLSLVTHVGNDDTCTVIDVETGQEAGWFTPLKPSDADLCVTDLSLVNGRNENPSPNYGVMVLSLEESGDTTYVNTDSGKAVSISKDDTFKGEYVGGNGIVYGRSGAVQGTSAPAYLDLTEGTPKTLGPVGTLPPLTVSGDGTALFKVASGLVFVNPLSSK